MKAWNYQVTDSVEYDFKAKNQFEACKIAAYMVMSSSVDDSSTIARPYTIIVADEGYRSVKEGLTKKQKHFLSDVFDKALFK